jgi:hypothetical protein
MKASLIEVPAGFKMAFEAETVEDAAILVRLKLNAVKEIIYLDTCASEKGKIDSQILIRKRKRETECVSFPK